MMLVVAVLLILLVVFVISAGVTLLPALLPMALVGTILTSDGQPITQVLTEADVASGEVVGPSIAFVPSAGLGRGRPSQFGLGLASYEAYAACGPAAAIGYADALGRSTSAAEIMSIARRGWWDAGVGMHGVSAEQGMLRDLGLPSQLEWPVNWQHVIAETAARRPVILDTPGHYYFVDAYDDRSKRLHVGTSGTDLRGGDAWLTPGQINAMGVSKGSVRSALYAPPVSTSGSPPY